MPHGHSYPDPEIVHGNFKVLPRTDGLWAVIDVRRKLGKKTVGLPFKTKEWAAQAAEKWHGDGHG